MGRTGELWVCGSLTAGRLPPVAQYRAQTWGEPRPKTHRRLCPEHLNEDQIPELRSLWAIKLESSQQGPDSAHRVWEPRPLGTGQGRWGVEPQ